MTRIEWNDATDKSLLAQIVGRWRDLVTEEDLPVSSPLSVLMNLQAANGVNGNPRLDLEKLIGFDDTDFWHDMAGVARHMNRETRKIEGPFRARSALAQ